jgi:5-methyltetrahydropteroyltriglutamate--homocysteine methyltransferase
MLTGPYTMMDWSFDEHYGSREGLAMAFARVLHEEARDLERAGARVVQIDEPALSARSDELDFVAKTIVHTCYGNYDSVYPYFNRLPVDQLDLEMSNSELDLLDRFRREPLRKEIAFGVIDVHSHIVETEAEVRDRIERALAIFPPEKLYVDPDCGLKTRTVEEAQAKLQVMVTATRAVKETRGLK